MELSRALAEFVSCLPDSEIPDAAYARAQAALIDYMSVLIAGTEEEVTRIVRRTIDKLGGHAQATVWGAEKQMSVVHAALANAVAAHALDFDDTNAVMIAHPSIQIFPGLLALGEYKQCSGKDILSAYIIGFEVGAKIGRIINPAHVAQGWLPIGTLGPIMEAAACCRLLRLSLRQTQMALGLSTNLASGIRCNNGTMAKPYLAGHSAASGVQAALLAEEGLTSDSEAFGGRFGFFDMFSNATADEREAALAQIGKSFDIVETGISFKLYPCCAGAHGAVDCALAIAQGREIVEDAVDEIRIFIHAGVRTVLIHPLPETAAEARFSLEYCVSRALLDRRLGPQQFSPEKVTDAEVRALMAKVKGRYATEPVSREDLAQCRFPVRIEVIFRDGTVSSAEIEYAKGTANNPLSQEELEEKYHFCCEGKMAHEESSRLLAVLNNFIAVDRIVLFK